MHGWRSASSSPFPEPVRGGFSWREGTLVAFLGMGFMACYRGWGDARTPVAVAIPLEITSQPQGATVAEGASVTFTAAAKGTGSLSFLWFKDGSPLVGAREASLTLTAVKAGDTGSYRLQVMNGKDLVVSDAAPLEVQGTPVIEEQPSEAVAEEGKPVSLSVKASGLGLRYQWYKGGEPLAGAQGPAFQLKAARLEDAGAYKVTVGNLAGTVDSRTVALTVNPGPVPLAIRKFAASPAPSLLKGGKVTLEWEVAGATEITIEPGAMKTSGEAAGSVEVAPQASVTYVLKASNGTYSVTQELPVSVVEPFKLSWLAAAEPILPWNRDSTGLAWGLAGEPSKLDLTGPGTSRSVLGSSWTHVDSLQSRQTFTLAGEGPGGSGSATAQVAVQGIGILAGAGSGVGSRDGAPGVARFHTPRYMAADSKGNFYVSDTASCTIRKVTSAGVVSTLAGAAGKPGWADLPGAGARFLEPTGIVCHGDRLYVADRGSIRTIALDGSVSSLVAPFDPELESIDGLAVDKDGNLFASDGDRELLLKIEPDGTVIHYAGHPGLAGDDDLIGEDATFQEPSGLAVDDAGTLYVADQGNGLIRVVKPHLSGVGEVSRLTLASAIADPSGVLWTPEGGGAGTLYVSTLSNVLYSIDLGSPDPKPVRIVAGRKGVHAAADGSFDPLLFGEMHGMSAHPEGGILVADSGNKTLRRVTPEGTVSVFAGTAPGQGLKNGKGAEARFNSPVGVVRGPDGTVYVADAENAAVRTLTAEGDVDTFCRVEGYPVGLALGASGELYVSDLLNNCIWKAVKDQPPALYAGKPGESGAADGARLGEATFNNPYGLAMGPGGELYVADYGGAAIRKVTGDGVLTLPGGPDSDSGGGPGSGARFVSPMGIAVDSGGLVWVADEGNDSILTIQPSTGAIATVGDHPIRSPHGIACLPGGAGAVVLNALGEVRTVTPEGKSLLVAGAEDPIGRDFQPGPLNGHLDAPAGITVTPEGDYLVTGTHGVFRITAPAPAGGPTVAVAPRSGKVDDTVVFQAEVHGRAPFTYVWQMVRPGAGSATILDLETKAYLAHPVSAGEDGATFQVTVTDGDGNRTTSSPARLTVLP